MQTNDFMATGFHWFTGVVEDVKDTEQLGRVRVRCFGYHTDDKMKVPTDALPWATVMLPTTSASLSGVGTTHGLLNGSWVVGFFRDGESAQDPIIMGSVASGYDVAPTDNTVGFVDPDLKYPKTQGNEGTYNDTNINARGTNNIEDISDGKIGNPVSAYASEYPKNQVIETASGHVIERLH